MGVGKLRDCKVKLRVDETVEPVVQRQHRIPFHIRKKVEAELDHLEEEDIIKKVTGPTTWVSPLVFAPEKNTDEIRICVDLRQPNTAIKRTRHHMPINDELINDLNGATIFTKLDLRQGYHQLMHDEESRNLTTFSTHKGFRHYERLCFGVNSAAEIFQHKVSETIQDIPDAKICQMM